MKKLNELNNEELKKVYNVNKKLQNDVINDYQESEMDYISDVLEPLKEGLNDWSIGFHQYNYIKIKDNKSFLYGVIESTKEYSLLDESDKNTMVLIDNILEKINILECMDYSNKNYDILENWIDRKIEVIKNMVLESFNSLTAMDYDYMKEYFIEFYVNERMDINDYYINDNYELFKHIEYERSYLSA